MQERNYKSILYFISAIILITLGIQGYWNYKNYQAGKQQLINEVQISLDNAVESYYVSIAEENLIGLSISNHDSEIAPERIDSLLNRFEMSAVASTVDSEGMNMTIQENGGLRSISIFTNSGVQNIDTTFKKIKLSRDSRNDLAKWHVKSDSSHLNPFAELTTRVIFAMTSDTLKVSQMDSLVAAELQRKNLLLDYGIAFTNEFGETQVSREDILQKKHLTTQTKSKFLPTKSNLKLHFSNITLVILKRNIVGILLSLLMVVAVISCLLYLLQIIKQQKQLAEVKNDLISNITHEFKTPIATIGAAVEGIQHFNKENDPVKNKRYADISSQQVEKLNAMVEKLLETATLDSDTLPLEFEEVNLVQLLENACTNEALFPSEKKMNFTASQPEITRSIDVFHFENAINNIIDNAIKYGGDAIVVNIQEKTDAVVITIQDNGTKLTSAQAKQLFEKFYRVPKGNTHDVKGFGIGLFYTKKIIERHGGSIQVSANTITTFRILLPHNV